ncbi:MAG: EamA family transporter [Rhodospirillaceae bacterium]|nr:EamA family transporter [Rhodospirillaceae bacterium]
MAARHVLMLLVVAAVWGINIAVIKAGLAEMPPIAFVALRFVAVAAVLLPFVRLQRRHLRRVAPLSFTLGTLHFPLSFVGLDGVDASTAAIAIQLQVPFAALLAAVFFKERLGWRRLLGMAIAFAGIVVIAGQPRFSGSLLSLAIVIAAACIWAFASVQMKLLGDEIDVLALNAWVALLAVPQLALISWMFEDGQIAAVLDAGWTLWASVAYQALLVMVLGYGVWYSMMRRFPLNQVMPFTLLVPVFGVAGGVVLMGDRLSVPMLLGGAATIAGVAIIVLRRPRVIAPTTKAGL